MSIISVSAKAGVKVPPNAKKKIRGHRRTPFTEEEVDRFFRACKKSARDTAIFRLMCHRGLRVSEIGLILMEDWNPIEKRLTVKRLKRSNTMKYLLKPVEIQALFRYFRVRQGPDDPKSPMFPSRLGGPISRWPLTKLVKRYCAAAGIPAHKAHPHSFKHTTASLLAQKGVDVLDIKDRLGHADIRSTLEYISDLTERQDRFAEKTKHWVI